MLYFNGYPIGVTTLYVRLIDDVNNVSDLYSQSFMLMESNILISDMHIFTTSNVMGVSEAGNDVCIFGMNGDMMINDLNNNMIVDTMNNEMVVIP